MEFNIKTRPVAKERPRFANGRVFTPKRTQDFENEVKKQIWQTKPEKFEAGTHLMVLIECHFKPTKKELEDNPNIINTPCTRYGDWDNMAKSICDAMNGMVYDDDKQIVIGTLCKMYSEEDAIKIMVKEIDNGKRE